jgi:tol-pal system-associated acyl-CoA thioesterase
MRKFIYRVYYEDTDGGGVVYYANYLHFFERARTDYLRECGVVQSKLKEKNGVIFVVKKCEINYKVSAKLDDVLVVEVIVDNVKKASLEMIEKMYRESDGKLLCEGQFLIACVSEGGKVVKIPKEIIEYF